MRSLLTKASLGAPSQFDMPCCRQMFHVDSQWLSSVFKIALLVLLAWLFSMRITHSSLCLNADVHHVSNVPNNSVQTQPVKHHLLECVLLLPAISCKAMSKKRKTSLPLTLTIKLEPSKHFSCLSAEHCSHLLSSLSCLLCFQPKTCRWNSHMSQMRVPTSVFHGIPETQSAKTSLVSLVHIMFTITTVVEQTQSWAD